MSPQPIDDAFAAFKSALDRQFPGLSSELRPSAPFEVPYLSVPGSEEVARLWVLTGGQPEDGLGLAGGMCLLGPAESERARAGFAGLMTSGSGIDAVATPTWDSSRSLDPQRVRCAYFAAGWLPIFAEPLEANYLAVDLVPLAQGTPGQIVLCGRDEDDKRVVAPSLSGLLVALAEDCRAGNWQLYPAEPAEKCARYMARNGKRLLSSCRTGEFHVDSRWRP
jgi:cell wall assembly regulator SMI1